MRTVVLVIRLAKPALQTGADLGTNSNAVSNLDGGHLVPDFDGLANDFMTNADWKWAITPAAVDCVDIGAADAAAFNLDVDVAFFELLRFELILLSGLGSFTSPSSRVQIVTHFFLLEITPLALILDHVALKHFWVRHLEDRRLRIGSFEVLGELFNQDRIRMKI